MINPNLKIILPLCVLAAAGTGYWIWQGMHGAGKRNIAGEQPAPQVASDTLRFTADAPQLAFLQIRTVQAFPEPLAEALNARLTYDDNRTARVFSPVAGRVLHISTEAGRRVKASDPLLTMDSPDYAAAVADSRKADADLLLKQETLDRARKLFEVQGIARKDVEAAEADMLQAKAESQRAAAHLRNLYSNKVNANGEMVLRAPIGGIVSERQVNAGSEVRPDATSPLFVITDPKHLWLMVDLPEQQLDKIRLGQPVSIEVDAYPNETFTGKVKVIGAVLDPVTRRIQVRCDVDNAQLKLKPEMFARATPIAGQNSNLPRVPNTALVTQGLYSYVFVESSPGVLQRRRVALATQDRDYSYVKDGLHAGERIVTSGALLLNSELSGND
jgi:membrane fusion protein, heavy metal efflux system